MIEVRQLTKTYGPTRALAGIDLDVAAGRIVGFLGPNGAGKTTTLRILTCFMPPTSGSATVNSFDVFRQSQDVRRSIGYLPENTPLYPEMRVEEHLQYFGKLHGMGRAARTRRIDELTDRCGLTKIRRRLIGQLSKGNRQRVGLAQALLHDPPILVLDEPTIGLDPAQITEVRHLIVELGKQKTILLSTHILPEAERTCQDIIIIHEGLIVASGTPDELRARLRSGGRTRVELQANPIEVSKVLSGINGVASVDTTASEGWCIATVTPNDETIDTRTAIAETIVARQWQLRDLRHVAPSLEEYFIQVTSVPAAGGHETQAPANA